MSTCSAGSTTRPPPDTHLCCDSAIGGKARQQEAQQIKPVAHKGVFDLPIYHLQKSEVRIACAALRHRQLHYTGSLLKYTASACKRRSPHPLEMYFPAS